MRKNYYLYFLLRMRTIVLKEIRLRTTLVPKCTVFHFFPFFGEDSECFLHFSHWPIHKRRDCLFLNVISLVKNTSLHLDESIGVTVSIKIKEQVMLQILEVTASYPFCVLWVLYSREVGIEPIFCCNFRLECH